MITKDKIVFDTKQTYLLYNSISKTGKIDCVQFIKENSDADKIITMEDIKPMQDIMKINHKTAMIPIYNFPKWV
ncbi:hypothetical protein [Acetivibrio ethanolgignens]|uniref:Uncharacterized protein n=1 Tax=Acetivibrio ethanolgignens TaxID=290052 RepID=A0A0V8QF92_9FIRM|nr:hypothetical protein [Acetivibrio ethanolgignens]KSV59293.1 hypothetical protein ASU35_09460 [Acetivibrio ethanolgignens]